MKKTLLLAFAALCFVQSALAWGKSGHDAVAYIAETHLTKRAKAVIERYLGHSIVYDASWMDDYRAEPGYEMTNWWHVDYGKGEPTKDAAGNPLEPNVLRELNRAIERLRDYRNLDDSTVVVNLRYVIHLVGDMHCPSHVNYQQTAVSSTASTAGATWNTNTSSTVIHGGSGKHWLPVRPTTGSPRAGASVRSSTTGPHPATSWACPSATKRSVCWITSSSRLRTGWPRCSTNCSVKQYSL